jgi:hypothetical protein
MARDHTANPADESIYSKSLYIHPLYLCRRGMACFHALRNIEKKEKELCAKEHGEDIRIFTFSVEPS